MLLQALPPAADGGYAVDPGLCGGHHRGRLLHEAPDEPAGGQRRGSQRDVCQVHQPDFGLGGAVSAVGPDQLSAEPADAGVQRHHHEAAAHGAVRHHAAPAGAVLRREQDRRADELLYQRYRGHQRAFAAQHHPAGHLHHLTAGDHRHDAGSVHAAVCHHGGAGGHCGAGGAGYHQDQQAHLCQPAASDRRRQRLYGGDDHRPAGCEGVHPRKGGHGAVRRHQPGSV